MGIPDNFTCLLRNLYAGQEATVRTRCGTTDWFQIGKGICQDCIFSPCLCMPSTSCEMLYSVKHKLESRLPGQSVSQFSHSVLSDSLRPHEPQHVRPPCPSPAPRVYPDSCPLSQWCHPTIPSSRLPGEISITSDVQMTPPLWQTVKRN